MQFKKFAIVGIQQRVMSFSPCTGVSPSYLMFNKRMLRTRLDILNPKRIVIDKSFKQIEEFAKNKQENQKKYYKGSKKSCFKINENVVVKDYSVPGKVSWSKGFIRDIIGKQTYIIEMNNGKKWKRHANQIIPCMKPNEHEPDFPSTILDPLQKISPIIQENRNENLIEENTNIVNEKKESENLPDNKKEIVKYNLRERKPRK